MKIRWKRILKNAAVGLAFAAIALVGLRRYGQERLAQDLAAKIIRFHVLANSDSKEDQELKRRVRDCVGAYMQTELAGISGAAKSREIIRRDLWSIEREAEAVVRDAGYSYEVAASLAWTEFPVKTYGAYTFPAGEYEALRVVIGEGAGENWWCVMYPNMCFQNSVYETVDEEAGESLRQVLTPEEYEAVMEEGDYEIKFKWLSFLE